MGFTRTAFRIVVAAFAGLGSGLVAGRFLDHRHGWSYEPYFHRIPEVGLFQYDAALIAGVCGILGAALFAGGIAILTRRATRNGTEVQVLPVIAAGTIAVVIAVIPFLGDILWPGNPPPERVSANTYEWLLFTVGIAGALDLIVAAMVTVTVAALHDGAGERPPRSFLRNLLWTSVPIVMALVLVALLRLAVLLLFARLSTIQMFNLPSPGEAVALFGISALLLLVVMAALGYVVGRRWRRADILAGTVAARFVDMAVVVAAAGAYCADAGSPFPYDEHPPDPASAVRYYAMVVLGVPLFVVSLSLLTATSAVFAMRRTSRELAVSG